MDRLHVQVFQVLLLLVTGTGQLLAAVQFDPGLIYQYKFNVRQDVDQVFQVRVQAQTTIVAEAVTNGRQLCEFTIQKHHISATAQRPGAAPSMPYQNISERVLFNMAPSGEIHYILYEPEISEHDLRLHKMLLSLLSSKLMVTESQLKKQTPWAYRVNETGHEGRHEAEYHVQPSAKDVTFTKTRNPARNAATEEGYTKQVHWHRDLGVPHRINVKGHFSSPSGNRPGYKPRNGFGEVLESDHHFPEKENIKFPTLRTSLRGDVVLERTTQLSGPHRPLALRGLREDTLKMEPTRESKSKVLLHQVRVPIARNVSCVALALLRKKPNEGVDCFNHALRLMMILSPVDQTKLAQFYLLQPKSAKHLVMVDLLSSVGTNHTWRLLFRHLLVKKDPDQQLLSRFAAHLTQIKHPLPEDLVFALEKRVLRNQYQFTNEGDAAMLGSQLLLAYGVVVGKFHESKPDGAGKLIKALEDRLEVHDPDRHRQKRDAMDAKVYNDFVTQKANYILAVGNARVKSSFNHLISYVNATQTTPTWKRCAVQAISGYKTREAADALLAIVVTDDDHDVRQVALTEYQKHPHGVDLHHFKQTDGSYHRNVTSFIRHRTKRDIGEIIGRIWQGFQFELQSPSMNWEKTLGSEKVGASFGVQVINELKLDLRPLSGFGSVNADNKAWATINAGIIGQNFDVINAEVCFKGHFEYEINILKELGYDDIVQKAIKFKENVEKMITSITGAINSFDDLLDNSNDVNIGRIVDAVKNTINGIPDISVDMGQFGQRILGILANHADQIPLVQRIQEFLERIRTLVNQIKSDIMRFYEALVDPFETTLPWAIVEIITNIKGMFTSLKSITYDPKSSIKNIGSAATRIYTAVQAIVDAKNQLMEVNFIKDENRPEWLDIPQVLSSIKDDFMAIVHEFNRTVRADSADSYCKTFTGRSMASLKWQILFEILNALMEEIDHPFELVHVFLEEIGPVVSSFLTTVENVKQAWTSLKEGYETARTLLDLVFGPKISKGFSRKYLMSTSCGNGFWKSNGKDHYEHDGVDLKANVGDKVMAPFEGTVKAFGDRQIIIEVKRMRKTEVILENVKINDTVDTTMVAAGVEIGTVVKPTHCHDPHIHFSMRKKNTQEYIDPSSYMEKRPFRLPEWKQDCDHYFLKVLEVPIVQGRIVGDLRAKNTSEPVEPYDISSLTAASLERKMKPASRSSSPNSATSIFEKLGLSDIRNILKFRLTDMKFSSMMEYLAENDSKSYNKMNKLLDLVMQSDVPKCTRPDVMERYQLERYLFSEGKSPKGSKRRLRQRYWERNEVCGMTYGKDLEKVKCTPKSFSCESFTCCADIPYFTFQYMLQLSLIYHKCEGIFVSAGTKRFLIPVSTEMSGTTEKSIVLGDGRSSPASYQLLLNYSVQVHNNTARVTFATSWCSKMEAKCKHPGTLFQNLTIPLDNSSCNTPIRTSSPEHTGYINEIISNVNSTVGQVLQVLEETERSPKLFRGLVRTLRIAHSKWLIGRIKAAMDKIFDYEFNREDLCSQGLSREIGPTYQTFFEISFPLPIPLPIPPIILSFGAGGQYGVKFTCTLCLMSMKAEARAIPGVGAKVFGGARILILAFSGGVEVEGYLLTVNFPVKITTEFNKFPIDVRIRMDLDLIPLKLEVKAKAYIDLWLVRQLILETTLYSYETKAINKNIFNLNDAEPDKTPPRFISYSTPTSRAKRRIASGPSAQQFSATNDGCSVSQVADRDYTEPAFNLELGVDEDKSEVKLEYSIGTVPGGSDIVKDESLGGNSVVVSKKLVSGKPLYFTVCAKNSADAKVCTRCSIPTYDTTPPHGRVTPDFLTSSHPHILKGSALAIDDSELTDKQIAIGFGRGYYGHQTLDWQPVTTVPDTGGPESDPVKRFSQHRRGQLVVPPFKTSTHSDVAGCARECLSYQTTICTGFNFDYGESHRCELLGNVEGFGNEIHQNGFYHHFERKGIGHKSSFNIQGINLGHNQIYTFNFYLKNVIGYESVISSDGILVDLTPPEPGNVQGVTMDRLTREDCHEMLPAKYHSLCKDITPIQNHRYIIDGPGSRTVMNGPRPGVDQRYTRMNTFIAANWEGFHDNETGIFLYTWAVGNKPCDATIHPHHDPHAHLTDESQWTHTGTIYPLQLSEGDYHMTVRAFNKIEFGSPLALSVCHAEPYTVDLSPPILERVDNLTYNTNDNIIVLDFVAYDRWSIVERVEMGLGKSKRDTIYMPYTDIPLNSHVNFHHVIDEGRPTWVKLRITDAVEWRDAGHGPYPILVDTSPPVAGTVYDGNRHERDAAYQASDTTICANWHDFYDPDSGIAAYKVGFGMDPFSDDVVSYEDYDHSVRLMCIDVRLTHNQSYFCTVTAFHGGSDRMNITSVSNGVLVDTTTPVAGRVKDGLPGKPDVAFSSKAATASVSWKDFVDPESGINHFTVTFLRTHAGDGSVEHTVHSESIPGTMSSLTLHHLHLHHNDWVRCVVMATNGAGTSSAVSSDGFLVDLTTPNLHGLVDGLEAENDIDFTSSTNELSANWDFTDPESDIDHHQVSVYQLLGGTQSHIYPASGTWQVLPKTTNSWTTNETLSLEVGARYWFRVSGVNRAELTAVHHTDGVTVDNTPPEILWSRAGTIFGEAEELRDGYVLHNQKDGIWANWFGADPESGVEEYYVAIYAVRSELEMEILLPFTNLGTEQDRYLTGFKFNLTNTNNYPVYRVSVKCRNRAGLWSSEALSSKIKIVPEDQAGIVQDGPVFGQDDDFQTDLTTVTVTFHGFHSSKDDIAHYLWAVGTEPLLDDVMPFVPEGIMELDMPMLEDYESPHQAQIIVELRSSTKYYITVRGITGAGHVLESSSNGITVDTSAPEAEFLEVGSGILKEGVMYQQDVDTLTASWNVTDPESSINTTSVLLETYRGDDTKTHHIFSQPATGSLPNAAMKPRDKGRTNILTLRSTNKVGLTANHDSYPVVVDRTTPTDGQLMCPVFISGKRPLRCDWNGFTDIQSGIDHYLFSVGYEDGDDSILNQTEISGNTTYYFLPSTLNQNLSHGVAYYATLYAVNYVGLKSSGVSVKMVVDETPPEAGNIVILGDTAVWNGSHKIAARECNQGEGCIESSAICQRSTTSLQVTWSGFHDEESGILKFEFALGRTPGGTQILDFVKLPSDQTTISFDKLDLSDVRQVFVTIKAFNGPGQYRTATSNGVFISRVTAGQPPLRSLIVRDGQQRGVDLDFQNVNDELSANWDLSGDPCPLQRLEWTVQRADGLVLLPFTELEPGTNVATVDRVRLHDGETYRVTLRATNLLHFTHIIRSDGVTIQMEPLLPGVVRDGNIIGYDLTYQTSSETLSANWEGFGVERSLLNDATQLEAEIGQHQELLYYEVAAGTDRRFPATRESIRPFTNIGLNKTWTFTDLELIPETAVYYMTVRAHSTSTATTEVTSNGIRVGHVIQPLSDGEIMVPRFVPSATRVEFSWKGFLFVTPIIRYQWAIASFNSKFREFNCTDLQGSRVDFDVKPLSQAGLSGLDTVVIADELVMVHGETFTIFVTATSQSGGCLLATSEFTVDVTPPEQGSLRIANSVDKGVSFVADADDMMVHWTGYRDPESELTSYEILLIEGDSCSALTVDDKGDQFTRMSSNITSFRFMKLGLQENVPYFLFLRTYNGAGSSIVTRSLPVMLDSVAPTPGSLMDGLDLLSDLRFQSSLTEMTGTFLYVPSSAEGGCSARHFPFNAPNPNWHFVQTKGINQDVRKRIRFSQYQIAFSEASGVEMKMERAVTEELVQSAALLSTAELGRGGRYKVEIKSASSNLQAVTSVALRTCPIGEVWDYGLDEAHENRGSTLIRPNPIPGDTATSEETTWKQIQGFGFQIMPRTSMSEAAVLRVWTKSGNDTTSVNWQLRFDPSEDFHLYEMVVNDGKPDVDKSDWTLKVLVDGIVRAYMSGIPELPDDAVIQLSIWNLNDHVPQLNTEDIFKQPFASGFFRNAVLPAPVSAICRYANLFRGGLSPVEKVMAGVGSEPLLHDLVDFQKVTPPCVPCTNPCLTCDPSCSDTETQLIHVHLTGLDLPRPPPVTDGNTSLPVYYLTVSAVTGSGATATASSDGVMIDITPPELIYLYHLDVSWPDPEPTVYQGSNSTIAVVAYATDNETAIVDYAWSIGSEPGGEDIQTTTSVGPVPVLQNTSLFGVLQDNRTYYVTVVVTNEAGLTTTKISDGVTMMYSEPDESQTATGIYESAPAVTSISRKRRSDVKNERVVSNRQDGITVTWDAPRSPAAGSIHFGLSSSPEGRRDIFPNMRVGANNSGTVTLDQDGIHRQGERLGNISDARYLRRRTRSTENRFLMEPGRMIYLNMEVCTKGHKCSPMNNKVVVIKRLGDTVCITPPHEKIQCTLNLTGGKQILVTSSEVQTHEVPLLFGELTPDALQRVYNSAASEEFRPFVVDPENTRNQTERKLRQRVHQWEDINFFITDLSEKGINGPVTITFPFSNLIYTKPDNWGPQLLTWNSELLHWEYTLSSCSPEERHTAVDFISGMATVTMCSPRSVTVPGCGQDITSPPRTYPGPAFFSVASVSNTFHNTAPVPTSHRYFSMPQDGGILQTILKAWDADDDDFEWSLDPSYILPLKGHADITPDGIFEYQPCENCRGNETVRVIVRETRCDGEQALSTQLDLNIYVQAMVTNPSIYLISSSAYVFTPDGRNHVETVLEQRTDVNMAYKDLVLILVGVHIDGESTQLIHDFPLRGQLTVSKAIHKPVLYLGACSENLTGRTNTFIDAVLRGSSSPELPVPCSIHKTLPSAAADPFFTAHVVVYIPDYQFYGFDQMKFIARTVSGLHSHILTQDLYVAENRCENNGTCMGPSNDPDCTHKQRASGFENYWCLCSSGFTGRFCEVDIDECLSQPCPDNFTCVDMTSGYECYCDDGWPCSSPEVAPGSNNWIIGLAGACGALVLVAVIRIWFYFFHKRLPNKIGPSVIEGDSAKIKRPRSAWSDRNIQTHKKKPSWRSPKVQPVDSGDMELLDIHLDVARNFLGSSSNEATRKAAEQLHF